VQVIKAAMAEGEIKFPPTYKFDKRSNIYDTSKKQRVPSWCDRILWKKTERVILQSYDSVPDVTFSDHRPVLATFEVVTQKLIKSKQDIMKQQYYERLRFNTIIMQAGQDEGEVQSPLIKNNEFEEVKEEDEDEENLEFPELVTRASVPVMAKSD